MTATDVRARGENPYWFEMREGRVIASLLLVLFYSVNTWFLSWSLTNGLATLLVLAPATYAVCEHVLPPFLLLGNSRAVLAMQLIAWSILFLNAHVLLKIALLIVLSVTTLLSLPIYYFVFFKPRLGEDNTLLHLALFQGANLAEVRKLIDMGADVNAVNSQCDTPLHFAARQNRNGSLEIVEMLLAAGAQVNAENYTKKVPLYYTKKPAVAEVLLRHGSRECAPKWRNQAARDANLPCAPYISTNLAKQLLPEQTLCFLSHHKEDAASLAVHLHNVLCQRFACERTNQIFLDCNGLEDLRDLPALVRRTRVLLFLQTPRVLTRPFCLVELHTAVEHGIPIVPILLEGGNSSAGTYDFAASKSLLLCGGAFRDELEERNPGAAAILEAAGFSVNAMGASIGAVLPNLISRPFNPAASERVRASQMDDICASISTSLS